MIAFEWFHGYTKASKMPDWCPNFTYYQLPYSSINAQRRDNIILRYGHPNLLRDIFTVVNV